MRSKRCSKCGQTKTSGEFHRDRSKRDRLRPYCKECDCAYQRAYRDAHREEINARSRAYHEAHREARRASQLAYREAHRDELNAYDRARREAHREEFNALIRKRDTEVRNASREVATRNGEPWTPAEDHVVLTSEGTVLDIAIELGRTTSSISNRRRLLRRKAVTA